MATDTFGNTTQEAGTQNLDQDDIYGIHATSPADVDTAVSITFYAQGFFASPNVKGVIILHSDLKIIANGIGNPVNVPQNTPAWYTSTFATPPTLVPSTLYVLGFIADDAYLKFNQAFEINVAHYDSSNDYTTPTDPTDSVHDTKRASVYCTYNIAVEAVVLPRGSIIPLIMERDLL